MILSSWVKLSRGLAQLKPLFSDRTENHLVSDGNTRLTMPLPD